MIKKYTDAQLAADLGHAVHPMDERLSVAGGTYVRQQDGGWIFEERTDKYIPDPSPVEFRTRVNGAHYNGLTNAKMERLDILAEELAECLVAIGKIKRHGSVTVDHVATPPKAYWNTMALEDKLGQVLGVMDEMARRGDLQRGRVHASHATAWQRKLPYTHHQFEDDPARFSTVEPLEPQNDQDSQRTESELHRQAPMGAPAKSPHGRPSGRSVRERMDGGSYYPEVGGSGKPAKPPKR